MNSKSCLKMRKCTGYNNVVIRWLPFLVLTLVFPLLTRGFADLIPQTFRFVGSLAWISEESCLMDLTACPGTQDRLSVRQCHVPVPAV